MELTLKTEVGIIEFYLEKIIHEAGLFDFKLKCNLDSKFSHVLSDTLPCRLYLDDLRRLVDYFQNHCEKLENDNLDETITYVPLENDFQIKCLKGDMENGEGDFSINILFNYGKVSEEGSNCYFGFESVIDVDDLQRFCHGIEQTIKKLQI